MASSEVTFETQTEVRSAPQAERDLDNPHRVYNEVAAQRKLFGASEELLPKAEEYIKYVELTCTVASIEMQGTAKNMNPYMSFAMTPDGKILYVDRRARWRPIREIEIAGPQQYRHGADSRMRTLPPGTQYSNDRIPSCDMLKSLGYKIKFVIKPPEGGGGVAQESSTTPS